MSVNVIVDKDAVEYIKRKNDSVTISMISIKSGWCSTNQLSVQTGKPKNDRSFDFYKVDGVNIYLQKGLYIPNGEVKISLSKFLFIKSLQVSGIR